MKQLPFEWHQRNIEVLTAKVVLDPQTVERVLVLMATALIVVVRGVPVEEVADDER